MARQTFLSWFFLPAAVAVVLVGAMAIWISTDIRTRIDELATWQRDGMAEVTRSATLTNSLAVMHGRVMEVLVGAAAGQLDEEKVYEHHRRFVDEFARLENAVKESLETAVTRLAPDAAGAPSEETMIDAFKDYRNHVFMATEIAAVDIAAARSHLDDAWRHFVAFSKAMQTIGVKHADGVSRNIDRAYGIFDTVFARVMAGGGVGLAVIFLASLLVARRFSTRLEIFVSALRILMERREDPPPLPAVERLRGRKNGIGALAAAVSGFREALLDLRRSGESLLREEDRMRRLVDAVGVSGTGLLVVGPDYRVRFMNAPTVAWFGDQTGRQCHSAIANRDLPCRSCRIGESSDEEGVSRYRHTGAAGQVFDIVAVPFRDADGGPARLELVRDITAEAVAERRLRELVDALTRAMAEMERFAFIAAHDLQEPLRHVIIFAQRLERHLGSDLSPETRMDMESAVQAAWRMRNLINDLLQYSRVNAEGAAFRPFALRNAVDAALEHLIQAVAAARARIEVGELPEVTGDLAQIVSVFVHLISNALRYRHPDLLPEIEVTAERDGGAWIVSVRDNGIGIEASQHERIFDVFRRLHSGDRHGGTGIGLAIVRRIVERHGGRIWVESAPGKGSTFFFTLREAEAPRTEAIENRRDMP